MSTILFLAAILSPGFTLAGTPGAPSPIYQTVWKQANPEDPVTGKKVKESRPPLAIFLDRVYKFESTVTLEQFRASPERYASTSCPVCGKAVMIRSAAEQSNSGGRTWYFDIDSCKTQFEKDPGGYATYRCPACGGISLMNFPGTVTAMGRGREIYLCCASCRAKFEADSTTYLSLVVPEGAVPTGPKGSGGSD